jgi:hypothetical protein
MEGAVNHSWPLVQSVSFKKECNEVAKLTMDLPPIADVDEATVRAEMRAIIRSEIPELDSHTLDRYVDHEVEKWRESRALAR